MTTTTFASGTVIASDWLNDVDAAVYAASGADVGALQANQVGYTPAGTGAVATTVEAKLRECVSVLDFYANGVSGVAVDPTGVVDSTAGIQAALDSLAYGQTLVSDGGTFLISDTLDMTALASGADVRLNSIISAPSVALAVRISADQSDIYIKRINGNDFAGSMAVQVISTFRSNVQVDFIEDFVDGWEINGTFGYNGRNGTIYNNFDSKNISVSGNAFEYTTDTKTGGASPGYVNENVVTLRWIDAGNAILLTKSVGAVYRYDGNKFMYPGFEQITGNAFDIAYATRNALVNPRFENITGYHIREASDCSRNLYQLHYAPGWDKVSMGGVLATMLGSQIGTFATGDTVAFLTTQTATAGENIFLCAGYNGTPLKPNSLYFKDTYGYLFRDRIEVLDSASALKHIPLKLQIGATTTANVTAATYSVPVGTELLQISAAVQAQVVTMPVEMERNGHSLLMNVVVATGVNTIDINKSTGATTATIAAPGLYLLIYALDGWQVSNIGTAF